MFTYILCINVVDSFLLLLCFIFNSFECFVVFLLSWLSMLFKQLDETTLQKQMINVLFFARENPIFPLINDIFDFELNFLTDAFQSYEFSRVECERFFVSICISEFRSRKICQVKLLLLDSSIFQSSVNYNQVTRADFSEYSVVCG